MKTWTTFFDELSILSFVQFIQANRPGVLAIRRDNPYGFFYFLIEFQNF